MICDGTVKQLENGHLCAMCTEGCGRLAAYGYESCCKECVRTCGDKHGQICNSVSHAWKSLLDEGINLGTRLDFAPCHDLNSDVDFESNKAWLAQAMKLVQTKDDFKAINDICGAPPDELVKYVRSLVPVHRANQTVMRAIMRDGGLRSRELQAKLRDQGLTDSAMARLTGHPQLGALLHKHGVRKRDAFTFTNLLRPMLELRLEDLSDDKRAEAEARKTGRVRELSALIGTTEDAQETIEALERLAENLAEHTKKAKDMHTGIDYARDEELGTEKHVFSIVGANMGDMYGNVVLIMNPRVMQHPDFNMTITAATSYVSKRTYFHRPWVALGQVLNYKPVSRAIDAHCRESEDATGNDVDNTPGGNNKEDGEKEDGAKEDGKASEASSVHAGSAAADSDDSHKSEGDDFDVDVTKAVKVMRDGVAVDFTDEEMVEFFRKARLHPCAVDWEYFVAADLALQCRLFFLSKRETDGWIDKWTKDYREKFIETQLKGETPTIADITIDVIKNWYTRVNSHGCIEGHMPAFVPLDCADQILMPQSMYNEMLEELDAYIMSDGKPLSSRVFPLDDEENYGREVRKWQVNFFNNRAETVTKDGVGAQTDSRALSFGIEDLKGEDMFLPIRILDPTSGCALRFRVKGQHIRLALTNRRESTRDKDASGDFHVYFLAIGAFKNKVTFLKRSNKSGDPVCISLKRDERPDAMAFPDRYREYWFTYDAKTGMIRFGYGGKDQMEQPSCLLLEWTDPEPHQDLAYVAVSCWETPVDFAMFKCLNLPSKAAKKMIDIFKRFDTNGDGMITIDELSAVLKVLCPMMWDDRSIQQCLTLADKNGDGCLNIDEFAEWLSADSADWKDAKRSIKSAPSISMLGWGLNQVTLEAEVELLQQMLHVEDPGKLGSGRDSMEWKKAHGDYNKLQLRLAWKIHKPIKRKVYEAKKKHVKGEMTFLLKPGEESKVTTKLDKVCDKFRADSWVNEKFLLHGTKPESVLTIIHNGLSERFSGGLFGCGVYMAEDEKIDQYCTPDDGTSAGLDSLHEHIFTDSVKHPGVDLFYCFVVRVVLGIAVHTEDGATNKNPPGQALFASSAKRELTQIPDSTPAIPYHSLIGESGGASDHREILTFNGDRTVLEYLLAYSREP